jgi:hypothetical protein
MLSSAAARRGAALRDRALADRYGISRTVKPGARLTQRGHDSMGSAVRKRSTAKRPRKAHAQKLRSFT